ncbi:ectoine/hydroxyectoine ABC transporter permease subunit EhuD [Rhizobium hainanense]|uniref:Polar amino acid transport system permease protein n=1 Tax=Rhizobium hainanense TaxID=52131 RepID=A0A1C3WC97_9HYPH|nr:ectoine/hydroxyectoine ABC transporter permease subunit EhuD [Rhizobium hainanense]SCB37669.1 polar amino acid transport system permease protein [Rhizobium hainanense]
MFDFGFASAISGELLSAAIVTFWITAIAFSIAVIMGALATLLIRSNSRALALPYGVASSFFRGTPLLTQILFVYFVLPEIGLSLSPAVTGIVVLSVHYSFFLAEVYRALLDAIPRGQWEASAALGLSRSKAFFFVIFPQVRKNGVAPVGNYLLSMFKETPLLATISVTELMFTAKYVGSEYFRYIEPLTIAGAIYLAMSLPFAIAIRAYERKGVVPR